MLKTRAARTATRLGTAFALACVATPLPASPAAAEPLVTEGKWADPTGAFSWCDQVAGTTVSCYHQAHAGGSQALTSTCRTESVDLGPIAVLGTCQVTLSGFSSGTGKVVTPGFAPGCTTFGFGSATLTFSDSTGVEYPPVDVTLVNVGGVATFEGNSVNAAGVTVAHAEGSFTLACGSPTETARGSFKGSYETVV